MPVGKESKYWQFRSFDLLSPFAPVQIITAVQVADQYSGTAGVAVPVQASILRAAAPPQARAAPLPDHLGILHIQAATGTP